MDGTDLPEVDIGDPLLPSRGQAVALGSQTLVSSLAPLKLYSIFPLAPPLCSWPHPQALIWLDVWGFTLWTRFGILGVSASEMFTQEREGAVGMVKGKDPTRGFTNTEIFPSSVISSYLFSFLLGRIRFSFVPSCSPGCPRTHSVAKAGLQLMHFPCAVFSWVLDYRSEPQNPVYLLTFRGRVRQRESALWHPDQGIRHPRLEAAKREQWHQES